MDMTALAQRIIDTPLAPYMGLLQAMSKEEKRIVIWFLIETMDEPENDIEAMRQKLNIPESPKTKWFREHASIRHEWDRHEAWNRLTDEQRSEATRLHLTEDDMDERTFYIIEKHLRCLSLEKVNPVPLSHYPYRDSGTAGHQLSFARKS